MVEKKVYYRKIIKTAEYKGRTFYAYIIEANKDDRTEFLKNKLIDWILDFPKGEYLLGELEILGVDQEEIINLNELKLDEYGNRIFEEVGAE